MKNFIITLMSAMLLAVSGATFAGAKPPVDKAPEQQNPTQQTCEEAKPAQEANTVTQETEAVAQEVEAPKQKAETPKQQAKK